MNGTGRLGAGRPIPLVVDLDHTLIRTDSLLESLAWILFHAPLQLFAILCALPRGRARFKAAVAGAAELDCAALPYDEEVLRLIRERRARGGEVHLVTAAHRSIADGVGAHLGLFGHVLGSDGDHNLKGPHKLARIAEVVDGPFAYVGDCMADVPIWAEASEAIVVARRRGLVARVGRAGIVAGGVFERPGGGLRAWFRAFRIHQWPKNLILFAPIGLSQQLGDPAVLATGLLAFVLFGLAASATYVVNDLADLAADRRHETKRQRPFASGQLSIGSGVLAAGLLLAVALPGAFALGVPFGLCLAGYVALTLFYSFVLKRLPLVDVLTIGTLFTVRIIAGMALLAQPVSLWLTSFTTMLFTSLAMAKRHAEVIRAGHSGRGLPGRDYHAADAPLTVAVGMGAATASTLVMLMYMQFEASMTGLYPRVGPLFVIPLVLASWLMRIWSRAHRGTLHDDPVIFALRDPVSWGHAAAVLILWAGAVVDA